jgi:hypothetical protein
MKYSNRETAEIAISSILIYLITDKICLLLTTFTLRLMPTFGVESEILFVVLSILFIVFSVWVFIKLYGYYNYVSKNKTRDLLLFLGSYLFLILLFVLFNFIDAKYLPGDAGYSSRAIYIELYSISEATTKLPFLGVIAYFVLILRNKTIANIK